MTVEDEQLIGIFLTLDKRRIEISIQPYFLKKKKTRLACP